jgi:hypothetical protein
MSSIVIQGDTSGSITVEAPSVAGTHTLTLPKATGNIATDATVGLGTKNRIINGDMTIDQRGSGSTSVTSSTTYVTADRFLFNVAPAFNSVTTTNVNLDSLTPPAGFNNYIGCQVDTGTTVTGDVHYNIRQQIEGYNVADLDYGTSNAKTITVSFWVRSSLTGNFSFSLRNSGSNRAYVTTYNIASANTWEKKTITIVGDTTGTWLKTNGVGLTVNWGLGNSTGNFSTSTLNEWIADNATGATTGVDWIETTGAKWYLTGVQLEVGENATPFENRMYSQELAMCQRYYYKTTTTTSSDRYAFFYPARVTSATQATVCATYPTMRTSPSITQSGTGINIGPQGSTTAFSGGWVTPTSAWIDVTVSGISMTTGQCVMLNANNNANAYVAMSAEL